MTRARRRGAQGCGRDQYSTTPRDAPTCLDCAQCDSGYYTTSVCGPREGYVVGAQTVCAPCTVCSRGYVEGCVAGSQFTLGRDSVCAEHTVVECDHSNGNCYSLYTSIQYNATDARDWCARRNATLAYTHGADVSRDVIKSLVARAVALQPAIATVEYIWTGKTCDGECTLIPQASPDWDFAHNAVCEADELPSLASTVFLACDYQKWPFVCVSRPEVTRAEIPRVYVAAAASRGCRSERPRPQPVFTVCVPCAGMPADSVRRPGGLGAPRTAMRRLSSVRPVRVHHEPVRRRTRRVWYRAADDMRDVRDMRGRRRGGLGVRGRHGIHNR
jgi:hypothetical protein